MAKWNEIENAIETDAEIYTRIHEYTTKNAFYNDKAIGRDTLASPITRDEAMAIAKRNTFRKKLAFTAIMVTIAVFCY